MRYVLALFIGAATLLTVLPGLGNQAISSPQISSNPVRIVGIINDTYIDKADELLARSATEKTIDIIINSPGGMVVFGNIYINAMELVKSRGVKLRCYVTHIAASMAFQILAHCSERYALENSYLLWHPVRIAGQMELTPQLATSVAKSLALTEEQLLTDLRKYFKPSDEDFLFHYYQESLLPAQTVNNMVPNYINIVADFPGIQVLDEGTFTASTGDDVEEEVQDNIRDITRRIIYIMPGYSYPYDLDYENIRRTK